MAQVFLGSLMLVSFNFPPKGFAFCNGQLLPISQNAGLFSLLGTRYGGNGETTFALPNLQGRIALHMSNALYLGEELGTETETLSVSELPAHTHGLTVSTSTSQVAPVAGMSVGPGSAGSTPYGTVGGSLMSSAALTSTGGSQAHENRSPFLVLNWVIALTGIFPSRN